MAVTEDSNSSSLKSYIHSMDLEFSRKMGLLATKGSSPWRSALILLEVSGHGVPWIAATLYFVLTCSGSEQSFACNVLAALLLDLVVVGLLKMLVRRQRPTYNEMDMFATVSVDNYSFPSGHSSRGAMLAGLFGVFLRSFNARLLIYVWSCSVAVSRVVLGRHHVTDVLCGVLIGWLQFWLITIVWLSDEACLCAKDYVIGHWLGFTS